MPEPVVAEKTESVYQRDIDNPYETQEGKVTVIEKIKITVVFNLVYYTVARGSFITEMNTQWFMGRYAPMQAGSTWHGVVSPHGGLYMLFAWKVGRNLGICPRMLTVRYLLSEAIGVGCWASVLFNCKNTFANFIHTNVTDGEVNSADSKTYELGPFICPGLISCALLAPEDYRDVSPWGTYCCGFSGQIRLVRIIYLAQQVCMLGLLLFFMIYTGACAGGALGEVYSIVMFAWKKAVLVLDFVCSFHDTPYKGESVTMIGAWDTLLVINSGAAIMMTVSFNWNAVLKYVMIDNALFGVRLGLLLRVGERRCPKLVHFMVEKAIENYPSPLPNHVRAAGAKTAMRVQQGFLCNAEGEAMTCIFVILVVHFVWQWTILGRNRVINCWPMRNWGVLIVFTGSAFIQDLIADHRVQKFSNYSWFYTKAGWCSWKYFPYLYYMCFNMTSYNATLFKNGENTFNHRKIKWAPGVFPTEFWFSTCYILHY